MSENQDQALHGAVEEAAGTPARDDDASVPGGTPGTSPGGGPAPGGGATGGWTSPAGAGAPREEQP